MSISNEDWERGRTKETDEEKILSFLRTKENQPYTALQMAKGIGYTFEDFILFSYPKLFFMTTLNNLLREGKIEAKEIKTKSGYDTYYKLRE